MAGIYLPHTCCFVIDPYLSHLVVLVVYQWFPQVIHCVLEHSCSLVRIVTLADLQDRQHSTIVTELSFARSTALTIPHGLISSSLTALLEVTYLAQTASVVYCPDTTKATQLLRCAQC